MKTGFVTLISCFALAFSGCGVFAQTTPNYDALVRQGNIQLQAGNNERALSTAKSAIRINANRWEAYAVAGGAVMNLKRYEEAVDQFSHAIDHAPEAKQPGLRDLRKQCLLAEAGASPVPAATAPQSAPATQAEIVLWKTIENSTNVDDFQAYLQQYPNGAFAVLARNHMIKAFEDQGANLMRSGNASAAVALWERGCAAGDAQLCKALGWRYLNGVDVPRDPERAFQFSQKACDGGDMEGCSNLSLLYAHGTGTTQDFARSVQYSRKACDGGQASGCGILGTRYDNGEGVTQDFALALQLFQKACDAGDAHSCGNLGVMYENGSGVSRDPVHAMQLDQKACDGGDADGCGNLGVDYAHGEFVTQDFAHAMQLFQKACDAGSAHSCRNLGVMYASGQGASQDTGRANQFYQKACTLGDSSACGK